MGLSYCDAEGKYGGKKQGTPREYPVSDPNGVGVAMTSIVLGLSILYCTCFFVQGVDTRDDGTGATPKVLFVELAAVETELSV